MPRRPPTRGRGDPDPNALFDDDSGEGDSAPNPIAGGPGDLAHPPDETEPALLPFDARLIVEKGDYAGKVVKLGGGTAMIGRSSKCELSLKGSSGVSRRHCKVQFVADRYVVIDLESRNGTVVNSETVSRKFLNDGDLLEIGDEHVRFIAKKRADVAVHAPAASDSDIDEQPTAVAAPVRFDSVKPAKPAKPTPPTAASATTPKKGGGIASPPLTTPDKGEANSAQGTSPKRDQKPKGKAPPPLPPADLPSDRTASFVMDPSLLASSRDARDEWSRDDKTRPVPPPLDDSAPYTLQPPRRSGFRVVHALLVLVLLVLALVGVAVWDLTLGERRLIGFLRHRAPAVAVFLEQNVPYAGDTNADPDTIADAGAPDALVDAGAARADADAGTAAGALDGARDDAGTRVTDAGVTDVGVTGARDVAPVDAGIRDDARDAGTRAVDAGSRDDASGSVDGRARVTVAASSGGRVASVRVKVGDVVKKGQTLAVLEAAGGLRRKLDALREEERAFEQAVKKGNKAARRDLDQVRADIAELSRRVRGAPLVSDADGTVGAVLVLDGATVKAGDPIVSLTP